MAADPHPRAAAVVVGSELLSGKIADTNTPYLARALHRAGLRLGKVTVVPDEASSVEAALRDALGLADHVFTSGGIGPTHDDITVACVARVLGRPIVRHPEMERRLRQAIGDRITEVHLRMADLPEGTRLVGAKALSFPALQVGPVYLLPGIPEIFREKVDQILTELRGAPFHGAEVDLRMGEGSLAPHLEAIVAAYPRVAVGSYPRVGDPDGVRVRVTFEGDDADAVHAARDALIARLDPSRVISWRGT